MAGSNDYIIKLGATGAEAVIAGQLDGTMTQNGAPVDVTNKSDGGKIRLFADFVAGQQITFAGTFTLLSETVQNTIKAAIESGAQIPGIVETAVGGEAWQCDTWSISGRSDAAPVNGVPQMSVTFSTSGAYTYTAATP
jgi:hypothetical protein